MFFPLRPTYLQVRDSEGLPDNDAPAVTSTKTPTTHQQSTAILWHSVPALPCTVVVEPRRLLHTRTTTTPPLQQQTNTQEHNPHNL